MEKCDLNAESSDQDILMTDTQNPSGSLPDEDTMDHKHAKCLPESSKSSESSKFDPSQSMYYLKRFKWKGEPVQIVTQNENGPCPLLAIANVLILSNRISIPHMQEYITAHQLMEYIGDYILSSGPKVITHLDNLQI